MKYILAIGIFFKHFRGSTKINMYSNDYFIDEIVLDQNLLGTRKAEIIHDRFENAEDLLNLGPSHNARWDRKNYPNKLFVYEIAESVLGEQIRFEINDKNTNYTNGFMTDSNLVAIDNIMLFPKDMVSKEKLPRTLEFMKKRCNEISLELNVAERDEYDRNYISWPGTLDVFDTETDTKYGIGEWLGGQKKFHVKVRRKFGIHLIWNGRNYTNNLIRFGNPKEFIEYLYFYRLINIVNENQ